MLQGPPTCLASSPSHSCSTHSLTGVSWKHVLNESRATQWDCSGGKPARKPPTAPSPSLHLPQNGSTGLQEGTRDSRPRMYVSSTDGIYWQKGTSGDIKNTKGGSVWPRAEVLKDSRTHFPCPLSDPRLEVSQCLSLSSLEGDESVPSGSKACLSSPHIYYAQDIPP